MESGEIPFDLLSPNFTESIAFQLLDEIPAAVFVIRDNGDFVYANSQAHQDLGFRQGVLGDLSINDLVQDHESRLLKKWSGLRTKNEIRFKEVFCLATGERKWFEVKAKLHIDSADELAVCTLQNLPDQNELNRRNAIAQIAFENTTDLIYIVSADATIVEVNEGACAALGYSRQELLGAHVRLINPNYSAKHFLSLQVRLNTDGSAKFESSRQRKDGSVFPVEVSTSFHQVEDEIFYFVIARDISKRKQVENDLLKTQVTVDNCADAVFWFDRNGRFVYVNQAACKSLGYSEAELKCLSLVDIAESKTEDEIHAAIIDLTTRKQLRLESKHISKDGRVFPVDIVTTAHQVVDEQFYCATVRDLTESKQHENLIHDLSAQLAHVNRLSSMGELASNIAHELNQPLTAIATNAFVLETQVSKLRPTVFVTQNDAAINIETMANDIMNQALNAGEIVHGMREFVTYRMADKVRTDLNLVVEQALSMAIPQINSLNVHLETQLSAGPLLGMVDPIQIQQIIVNLIRNSLDSLAEIEPEHRYLRVKARRKKSNGYTLITVQDSGGGIPADVVGRLFDPFESTKDDGMGIGLSISGSIAKNHGGKLIHNAAFTRGAEFFLLLPPLKTSDSETSDSNHSKASETSR